MLVRRAFLRKERLEEEGRAVDPLTRAVAAAPRALGIHVGAERYALPPAEALLREPNPAVIATLKPNGAPHSVATWYLWEDGAGAGQHGLQPRPARSTCERDPRVSLTVLDAEDWYHHVSLRGRVVSLTEDEGLVNIDRLCPALPVTAVSHAGPAPLRRLDRHRHLACLGLVRYARRNMALPRPVPPSSPPPSGGITRGGREAANPHRRRSRTD